MRGYVRGQLFCITWEYRRETSSEDGLLDLRKFKALTMPHFSIPEVVELLLNELKDQKWL